MKIARENTKDPKVISIRFMEQEEEGAWGWFSANYGDGTVSMITQEYSFYFHLDEKEEAFLQELCSMGRENFLGQCGAGQEKAEDAADVFAGFIQPWLILNYPKVNGLHLSRQNADVISILFKDKKRDEEGNLECRGFILTGFGPSEISEITMLGMRFGPYSRNGCSWAYHDEQLLIYTYCEGDTYLKAYKDEGAYREGKKKEQLWFLENA